MYLRPGKFFRNQILLDYSGRWRNQSCQKMFQSVHSGVSGKGSNFAIFSVNRGWPLQLLYYRTTVKWDQPKFVEFVSTLQYFIIFECTVYTIQSWLSFKSLDENRCQNAVLARSTRKKELCRFKLPKRSSATEKTTGTAFRRVPLQLQYWFHNHNQNEKWYY